MSKTGVEADFAKSVSSRLIASLFSPDESASPLSQTNSINCKSISLSFLTAVRDAILASKSLMKEHTSFLETLSIEHVITKVVIPAAKASRQSTDK